MKDLLAYGASRLSLGWVETLTSLTVRRAAGVEFLTLFGALTGGAEIGSSCSSAKTCRDSRGLLIIYLALGCFEFLDPRRVAAAELFAR